jgi:hypothetical protein
MLNRFSRSNNRAIWLPLALLALLGLVTLALLPPDHRAALVALLLQLGTHLALL